MKKTLLFCCFICLTLLAQAQNWKEEYYAKCSYKAFAKYKPAHQRIDYDNVDYALLNAAVFYATNYYRDQHGLPQFKYLSGLEKAAQGHSEDMANHDFFSHDSPVPGKESPGQRLDAAGVDRRGYGENIIHYYGYDDSDGIPYLVKEDGLGYASRTEKLLRANTYIGLAKNMVGGWMDSPGHRAIILKTTYTHLGCGSCIAYRGDAPPNLPWFYSTQNFASIAEQYTGMTERSSSR